MAFSVESLTSFRMNRFLRIAPGLLAASLFPMASLPVRAGAPAGGPAAAGVMVMNTNISQAQVTQAQQAWCNALLAISRAYRSGGLPAARTTAEKVLDDAYAYQYGPVAFKPTLTSGAQTFRPTKEGALAYFVGNNPRFPKDSGFAINPWEKCTIRTQVIQLHGDLAITMGNVDITDNKGNATTVDKTWAFLREPDGQIRIVLHHSSLPYKLPTATAP